MISDHEMVRRMRLDSSRVDKATGSGQNRNRFASVPCSVNGGRELVDYLKPWRSKTAILRSIRASTGCGRHEAEADCYENSDARKPPFRPEPLLLARSE